MLLALAANNEAGKGTSSQQPHPPFVLEASSVPRFEIPFRSGGCSPEIVSSQSGCGAERRVQRDGWFQPFQYLRRHGRLGACLQVELAKLPSCSKIRTGSYKHCTITLPNCLEYAPPLQIHGCNFALSSLSGRPCEEEDLSHFVVRRLDCVNVSASHHWCDPGRPHINADPYTHSHSLPN